jgi:RimJ/RimL family protein N-acetyltransferase
MPAIPTLETERLLLRPYRREDFEPFAAMWADHAVVRFIGGQPFTREQSWIRFLRQAGMWEMMGFGFFALEEKATGAFVGEAGFHELYRDISPSLFGTLETGWGLTRPAQGQGLAEEAVRAALAWADEAVPGLRRTCMIEPGNVASIRVAEKLGFRGFGHGSYHGTPMLLFERTGD